MTTPHRTLQQALDALENSYLSDEHRNYELQAKAITALREALAAPEPEPVAWEGAEEWESLAWELCANENGEDACNELIWEGGPIKEPWGERWLKYEGEAKRMIALVRKHVAAPVPDGWVMVPMEPTPEMIAAMPYPANTIPAVGVACYRAMIAASPAAPAAPVVPLTDEQIRSMWKSSEFRGNGGQVDWFCEGIRAAEAHHGITGASK